MEEYGKKNEGFDMNEDRKRFIQKAVKSRQKNLFL